MNLIFFIVYGFNVNVCVMNLRYCFGNFHYRSYHENYHCRSYYRRESLRRRCNHCLGDRHHRYGNCYHHGNGQVGERRSARRHHRQNGY